MYAPCALRGWAGRAIDSGLCAVGEQRLRQSAWPRRTACTTVPGVDDAEAVKAFGEQGADRRVASRDGPQRLVQQFVAVEHRMAAQVLDAASGTSLHTVRLLNLSCRSFHRISIASMYQSLCLAIRRHSL